MFDRASVGWSALALSSLDPAAALHVVVGSILGQAGVVVARASLRS